MNELEWCLVCKAHDHEYTEPIALMALGNLQTMSVKVSAYCRDHLAEITQVFQRGELFFAGIHLHVDEILIRAL